MFPVMFPPGHMKQLSPIPSKLGSCSCLQKRMFTTSCTPVKHRILIRQCGPVGAMAKLDSAVRTAVIHAAVLPLQGGTGTLATCMEPDFPLQESAEHQTQRRDAAAALEAIQQAVDIMKSIQPTSDASPAMVRCLIVACRCQYGTLRLCSCVAYSNVSGSAGGTMMLHGPAICCLLRSPSPYQAQFRHHIDVALRKARAPETCR